MLPQLPVEIISNIARQLCDDDDHCAEDTNWGIRLWLDTRPPNGNNRKDLAAMRLASRLFCEAATPCLFSHVTISSAEYKSGTAGLDFPPALRRLSALPGNGDFLRHIRHVRIDIKPYPCCSFGLLSLFTWDFTTEVPKFLEELPRLETLVISHGIGFVTTDNWLRGHWNLIRSAAISMVIVYILRNIHIQRIKRLALWLPASWYLRALGDDSVGVAFRNLRDALRNLRYLSIGFYDAITPTVPQQHRLRGLARPTSTSDYVRLLSRVFRDSSEGLEHLHMEGDMYKRAMLAPGWSMDAPGHERLRSVSLYKLSSTADDLVSYLGNCPKALSDLRFNEVELLSGTWAQVLLALVNHGNICDICVMHCDYAASGSSGWLSLWPLSNPDISTRSATDLHALGLVQRMVNRHRVRKNLRPFDKSDFLRLDNPEPTV
ncbi:hypothetical protein HIM_02034 [Hirsutella minnesotensis 3608]|nr:hypothetical protein HIM_02034 [Hirsutella minnesotensis 3608]